MRKEWSDRCSSQLNVGSARVTVGERKLENPTTNFVHDDDGNVCKKKVLKLK